jgi:Putative transposase
MTLQAGEFMRRFLLHVLPDGFRRIRHFGFLANAHRTTKLTGIRALLDVAEPEARPEPANYRERYVQLTGQSLDICRRCGGVIMELAAVPRAPPSSRSFWCTVHDCATVRRPDNPLHSRRNCRRRDGLIAISSSKCRRCDQAADQLGDRPCIRRKTASLRLPLRWIARASRHLRQVS